MPTVTEAASRPATHLRRWRLFAVLTLALAACFYQPLWSLWRLSLREELYSYIPLVPLIVGYLVWLRRSALMELPFGSRRAGFAWAALGVAALILGRFVVLRPLGRGAAGSLSFDLLAFYCFILSLGIFCCGSSVMRKMAFPAAFLIFIIPLPTGVLETIEVWLQRSSAEAADAIFAVSGIPTLRHGMVFQLPGISISVAPECSGIRSTLVLFMTSLLAGHIFLRSRCHRTVLALFVIPLAIVRNACRIVTIAALCVYVGPHMIESVIHRRGGPFFFVLSLIPFFALLLFLMRRERRQRVRSAAASSETNEPPASVVTVSTPSPLPVSPSLSPTEGERPNPPPR